MEEFLTLPAGPFPGGHTSWGDYAAIGFAYLIVYLWVVFDDRALHIKILYSVLVLTWLVCTFSRLYYYAAKDVSSAFYLPHDEHLSESQRYPGFGKPLSRLDAVYFTVGTLTTAGTGSLSARSAEARCIAISQMALDVGLLGFGVAGLTNPNRVRRKAERRS